jgi:predicted DNA-binding ribbon-helix-helix protein
MSALRKRSVRVAGHPTSVSLEDAFWSALADIARRRGTTPARLIDEIDARRGAQGLSSAIRVFVLANHRSAPGR